MSRTFTKLFSSITESTVWCEPDRIRLAWICMLAMADQHGRVWGSIPGIANRARIPVEDAREAIDRFLSPDPDSRTKDFEGRRIEPIDGGWRLLNHEKYRAIRDEESIKESKRNYINARRAKERVEKSRTESNSVDSGRANAEADTEAELKEAPTALVERFALDPMKYRVPDCPYEKIIAEYHEALPSLPKLLVMTPMRQKHIRGRWADVCGRDKLDSEGGLDFFHWYFGHVAQSAFLGGRSTGKDARLWKANLDWLMHPGNFAKVLEGNYHQERAA